MSLLRQKDNISYLKARDSLHFTGSASVLTSSLMLAETLLMKLRLLSLCANEREDGAAYGTQMKENKSIMS